MLFTGYPQTRTQLFYCILHLFHRSSGRNGYIDGIFPRTESQAPGTGIHLYKETPKFIIFQYIFQNNKISQWINGQMNEISSEYTSDRATKNGQVSENEHMIQKNIFYVSTLYRFGMNIDLYNMTGRSLKSFFKKEKETCNLF